MYNILIVDDEELALQGILDGVCITGGEPLLQPELPRLMGQIKALGFAKFVLDSSVSVPAMAYLTLAVGCLVSFGVSLAAIRFLMDFVKKHSFASFGWYRIVLGALVIGYFLIFGR